MTPARRGKCGALGVLGRRKRLRAVSTAGRGLPRDAGPEHPVPQRRADAKVRLAVAVAVFHVIAPQELPEPGFGPEVMRVVVDPVVGQIPGQRTREPHHPELSPKQQVIGAR